MATFWVHNHQCVSCQYWAGSRSVKSDPRLVESPSGAKGTCMGLNSSYRNRMVDGSVHIGGERCYSRWYAVRD